MEETGDQTVDEDDIASCMETDEDENGKILLIRDSLKTISILQAFVLNGLRPLIGL